MEHQTPERQDLRSDPPSPHAPEQSVTDTSEPQTPISLDHYNFAQSSTQTSPYRRRPLFSKARCLAHRFFPALFFAHFLITGTVILHYTLVQHRPLPRTYTIGAAITFGVLILLIFMSNLLLYLRRQYGSDAMDDERSSTSGSGMGSLRDDPRVSPRELDWCKCRLGQWLIRYERKSLAFQYWNAGRAKRREEERTGKEAEEKAEESAGEGADRRTSPPLQVIIDESIALQDERRKTIQLAEGYLGAGRHYRNSDSGERPRNPGCVAGFCLACCARALERTFDSRSQKPVNDVTGSQGSNRSPHGDTKGHRKPHHNQTRRNDENRNSHVRPRVHRVRDVRSPTQTKGEIPSQRMSDDAFPYPNPTPDELRRYKSNATGMLEDVNRGNKRPAAHLRPARAVPRRGDARNPSETRRKPLPSTPNSQNTRLQRTPQIDSSRAPVIPASRSQALPLKKPRKEKPPAVNEIRHPSQHLTPPLDRNQSSSYTHIHLDRKRLPSTNNLPSVPPKIMIASLPVQGNAEKYQGKAPSGQEGDRKQKQDASRCQHKPGAECQNPQIRNSNVSQDENQTENPQGEEDTEDMAGDVIMAEKREDGRPYSAYFRGAERRTSDSHLMESKDLDLEEFLDTLKYLSEY